jgi:hypothetical protein
MSNDADKWYVNRNGKIVAGLIMFQGKRTAVGDKKYLPAPWGKGEGTLEKKLVDPEDSDNEAPDLADILDLPKEL